VRSRHDILPARALWGDDVWLVTAAWAHVGDVIGGVDVSVFREEDVTESPAQATIEANFGLLLPAAPGAWDWVCHEAVTAPKVVVSPRYTRSPSGAFLAYVEDPANGRDGHTLFRSADGCDWPAVESLLGQVVASAAFDPADELSAWAATATPEAPNAIWASADGGVTFAPAFPPVADRQFQSVVDLGDELWATARDEAGQRLFLWHAGADQQWSEAELVGVPTVIPDTDVRVLTPAGPGEAWLVVDPYGDDIVIRAAVDGSYAVAPTPPSWITDGAWDGTRLWVVRAGTLLSSVEPDGTSLDHAAFPAAMGVTYAEGALWSATSAYLAAAMLSRSDDGAQSFRSVAWPDNVAAPLECPAESDQATVCAPLWDALLPRIRGFDDPPEETADTGTLPIPPHPDDVEEAETCGCASTGSIGWLGVLGLFALRRRR
jgi:hypothetical protein